MREMKDSGVEWVGEIPSDWNVFRNKNAFVCSKELVGDKSSETQLLSLTTKGIRLKDINNAEGKLPESFDTYQYVKENELVMCLFDLDCSAVFSGISPYAGMISPAYRVLTCTNRMIPKYADYWFQYISHGRKFNHYAKNIRYTLSYEEFSSLPMLFPNIEEQKKISDYLDIKCAKIDSIIEKQKAIIEKLNEYKLSVITEAVTKGLVPNVEMKDSGIKWFGNIPSHWDCVISRFVFDDVGDINHYMPESVDDGYPYLMIGDLKERTSDIEFEKCKKVSQEDFEELKQKMQSEIGDIIFARYATIGTVCYVDTDEDFLVSYACVTIKPNRQKLDGEYLFYYFKSLAFLEDVKQYINSNTQGNVGIEALYRTKITIPPLSEQKEITKYLKEQCSIIQRQIDIKDSVIHKLDEYKKSLIYEVVTGKKEV